MKKIFILLTASIFLMAPHAGAQIFWAEKFDGTVSTGLPVSSYSDALGAWTLTITGPEGTDPNPWYVSCKEAGHLSGVCGSTCSSISTSGSIGPTLHVGSATTSLGDQGASYDAGGFCGVLTCPMTDRRAESPTINCTGKTGITLSFYYIENGDTSNDDGSVYYSSDNGTTWSLLVNTPKTPVCASGQGKWQRFSMMLPASCNNNATVKIGFRWVNNDDGVGTDPSYAIDSIALSTGASATPPAASFTASTTALCQDSCITVTSTSTGTVDSVRWSAPGAMISAATGASTTICFPNPGSFTVKLYAYGGGAVDSSMSTITVNPAPHPVVSQSGHMLTVTTSYSSYQWVKNDTAIAGATSGSYTYTASGTYQVIVDSGGCLGASMAVSYTLGVAELAGQSTHYSVSQTGEDAFELNASQLLTADVAVSVFDATGRLVYTGTWKGGSDKIKCSAGSLSPGLYVIRLSTGASSAVLKWMKQ